MVSTRTEKRSIRRLLSPILHRVIGIGLAAVVALLLAACEELFFEPEPGTTPIEIFDQVWTYVDQEYSFFDYKGIDWDAVRAEFRPQVSDEMSPQELFYLLDDMLYRLQDGHVNLDSEFDRSRYWEWYLGEDPNYDFSVLMRNYLNNEHQYVGPFIVHEFRAPGAPDSEAVGYVHYRSFQSPVADEHLDYVIDRFADYKGLIIDVRDNGGGSLSNAYTIAKRLTDKPVAVAREQFKTGTGHENFGPLRTISIAPAEGASTFTKPVAVLMNRMSYSATNFFVALVQGLPHVKTIGRRSGGGGGLPAYTMLSNGWRLRVSSSRVFLADPDGSLTWDERNIEGGIAPDILWNSSELALATGADDILDKAITEIQTAP